MNSHFDRRSCEKKVFFFPVLCKEIKEEEEKSTQTGEGAVGEISRPLRWDLRSRAALRGEKKG